MRGVTMGMSAKLKAGFELELRQARAAEAREQLAQAWRHLERAHVLSQAYAGPHVKVHLRMLAFGLRRRDAHEVRGQVVRALVAAPGTWLGRAPVGNTGGANVGILTPMQIPDDLRALLAADGEN